MGRTHTIVGLVVLGLLLASGTGAAQSVTSSASASSSTSVSQTYASQYTNNVDVSIDEDAGAALDLLVDLDIPDVIVLEVPLPPEPQPDPGPEPAPEPAPEAESLPPAEPENGFEVATDGNASIDASGSASFDEQLSIDEEIVSETPEEPDDVDEAPVVEDEGPTGELAAAVDAAVGSAAEFSGGPELAIDEFASVEDPTLPAQLDLEMGDDGSFGFDFRGAFAATTDGFADAFGKVQETVTDIVDEIKATLDMTFGGHTEVQALTEIEAVGELAGSLDIVASIASGADMLTDVELPAIEMPSADVSADADAHSETSVSSGLTGDLGFGL